MGYSAIGLYRAIEHQGTRATTPGTSGHPQAPLGIPGHSGTQARRRNRRHTSPNHIHPLGPLQTQALIGELRT
eukprot:511132-Pyramimonas_sp.AAC.1